VHFLDQLLQEVTKLGSLVSCVYFVLTLDFVSPPGMPARRLYVPTFLFILYIYFLMVDL